MEVSLSISNSESMGMSFKISKRKEYLSFLLKAIRLIAVVFLCDLLIGGIIKHFYFHQKYGRQYRAYYTIEKTNADILIFGSSRAFNHYRPDIFESRLKKTCYNSGSPGQFILYDYATLKAVLKRYTPKLIILDLMPGSLFVEQFDGNSYERLSFLFPYYKEHEEMRPILELKGQYEKFKLLSSVYPFNSSVIYTTAGCLELKRFKELNRTDKGYQATYAVWNKPSQIIHSDRTARLDSVKINIYNQFIDECRNSGTELLIACSPRLDTYKGDDESLILAKKIAREKNVKFLDFTNDTFFVRHPELFAYDPIHLNHEGAGIFCNRVVDSLCLSN